MSAEGELGERAQPFEQDRADFGEAGPRALCGHIFAGVPVRVVEVDEVDRGNGCDLVEGYGSSESVVAILIKLKGIKEKSKNI